MRKLIVVVTLVATPLVAAVPAAAATADRPASGNNDAAAVMLAGSARQDLSSHPIAPLAPQARAAATTQHSAASKSGGDTAVLPRHQRDDAQMAWESARVPAAPVARASAGSALARAPPESA